MIHDQSLVDRLSGLATERLDGTVYRATRVNADPTAPSINGGRWAPPPSDEPGIFVLYTSFERDGAIAEMVSFLADLTPVPGPRPIKVTTPSNSSDGDRRRLRRNRSHDPSDSILPPQAAAASRAKPRSRSSMRSSRSSSPAWILSSGPGVSHLLAVRNCSGALGTNRLS